MKEDDDMLNAARHGKRNDTELPELSTVPTEALARLDRLVSAGLFTSGLAHEVASPLGALLGALDGLERRLREIRRRGAAMPGDVDELAEDLELASASAGAITDIVHDFQLYLRAEGEGRLAGADVDVDVGEAVARALRIARPRLGAVARVDVVLRAAPRVRARPSRIVQVVLNLLAHALEGLASRPRGENVVTVRVDDAGGRALIEVSDNGPGLPGGADEHLFDLRAQAGAAGGADLGLALSRELVRKMGGEIGVSSLPGAGTTFLVTLPAA